MDFKFSLNEAISSAGYDLAKSDFWQYSKNLSAAIIIPGVAAALGASLAEYSRTATLAHFVQSTFPSSEAFDFFRYNMKNGFQGVTYYLVTAAAVAQYQLEELGRNFKDQPTISFHEARKAVTKPLLTLSLVGIVGSAGWEYSNILLNKTHAFDLSDFLNESGGITLGAAYAMTMAYVVDPVRRFSPKTLIKSIFSHGRT